MNSRILRNEKHTQFPDFSELEQMFNEAFELLEMFQSTARMKMLLMMSEGPVNASSMRKTINPKLVYENISLMQKKKLIEELEEGFNLTEIGRKILAESAEECVEGIRLMRSSPIISCNNELGR